ncbi:hypothetical protein F8M41_020890 [Gigaspora margarita]|uniref:F-box domain-containing protein n=1 Tax=Gigaspora margarita TaxID=4874 RepID=A0A8H4AHP1_GIGMA|nr:hypothetical protein F8M41_020890 [Gigaspora margarita]
MASKIFMGNMPELMEKILENLNNEVSSLHSCALVSRHWCKMSIPLLWQDPFSFNRKSSLITNYFSSLCEDEKFFLKKRVINVEFSKTLFDYARFLKVIDLDDLESIVLRWISDIANEFHGILSALKSQKQSLREVKIEYCEYSTEFNVLSKCENLETLRLKICDYSVLNTIDYKISTLEIIDTPIEAKPIESFLKKSGTLLQRLKIEFDYAWEESETLLLNAIKSFCPNLKYLSIIFILFSAELLELIGSLQKLQFLTLMLRDDKMSEEESEIRYKEFVEILPITLQYLDLTNTRQNSYLDVWLNNCSAPLKRLLIDGLDNEKQTQALIEFCKRKRTLNCVGVSKYSELNDIIKKEVEMYVTLVLSEYIVIDC